MSTFSGLTGALSSIIAQRQALEVAGQNVANANTPGYTRQRADMTSIQALSAPTVFSSVTGAGNGVKVVGITRMGDVFLDARVRTETSSAAFTSARAQTLDRLESLVDEPSGTGMTQSLARYWAAWQDVANKADDGAARGVLLGEARGLVAQIADGYRGVETQWNHLRTQVDTLTTEVNTVATAVAELNEQIRSILVSGGSANELIDQRDVLVTKLSDLVGATARHREDGTVDVMVGGNALVRGVRANAVEVHGSHVMAEATTPDGGGAYPDRVELRWAGNGTPLELSGGRLNAHVNDLAAGGVLDRAAQSWNDVAQSLHDEVNAIHQGALRTDGTPGGDFFSIDPALPAALGISVALTSGDQVAAAAPGQGALDGSIADKIAQIGLKTDGPDARWRSFVVDLGVESKAAKQRADVAERTRATAEALQLANASVDLDEETINMLAFQRAYEGAARVLTAVDEMLDVLINRTGVVGR